MSNGNEPLWDWANRFFSADEIHELDAKSNQIIFNNENGLVVNIVLSHEQCMDLVAHYHFTLDEDIDDAQTSFEFLDGFLAHFTAFLDDCLTEINPNWEETYYD